MLTHGACEDIGMNGNTDFCTADRLDCREGSPLTLRAAAIGHDCSFSFSPCRLHLRDSQRQSRLSLSKPYNTSLHRAHTCDGSSTTRKQPLSRPVMSSPQVSSRSFSPTPLPRILLFLVVAVLPHRRVGSLFSQAVVSPPGAGGF